MKTIVLDKIPFQINTQTLSQLLHIKRESDYYEDFTGLVSEAKSQASPKALYRHVFIESRGDDFIVLEGITFTSRVLQVNLENVHRVFPFVATCGVELDDWSRSIADTLHRFWAEAIMGMALFCAITALDEHIKKEHGLKNISHMSPGSLKDWPLEQQRPLFTLLGDTKGSIGVELKENFFMSPTKTVSGIRFPTEITFESCMLCPQKECPGRRAPHNRDLYDKKYRKK